MTTATMTIGTRLMDSTARPRRGLEELLGNLMRALTFIEEPASSSSDSPRVETTPPPGQRNVACAIHEARRLRQAGHPDRALETLAAGDLATAEPNQARWAFTEWRQLVKRRYCTANPLVYTQGTGRAAALIPRGDNLLQVVAVLGMSWRPGKIVSQRSLRCLRPLGKARP